MRYVVLRMSLMIFSFYPYILIPCRNTVSFSVSKFPFILRSAFCLSSDHRCPKHCENRQKSNRKWKENKMYSVSWCTCLAIEMAWRKSLLLHSLNITQGCLCILSLKAKSKPRRRGLFFISSTLQHEKNCSCNFFNEEMTSLYRSGNHVDVER